MNGRFQRRHVPELFKSRVRRFRKPVRPSFELLEDRTMLDTGGLPAAILVGRTLATPSTADTATPSPSDFVGEVQGNQVTITYTAYNEQANAETGVLITSTLQPGATFVTSTVTLDGVTTTQLPDQSGQNLAWSLAPINGYDRENVAVTVKLASVSAMQLDTGAHVYASLNAGTVSNTTPAATLQPGNPPVDANGISLLAPPLDPTDPLAAGTDANDPFIQEEAAKLSYDPTQIFDFLHTQVGYNSYTGSLRGARGTLWSHAGNALDVANLGVALMRASGIPAQYVSGTLSQSQAQQLILSMFPASFQTVGYIPAGTQVSDPANDPQLLSETESHYWFQFDAGGGMQDADPLMAGATIGQTFATSTGTFTEIPDALRQKTEVQLVAEITSLAASLFGLGGQSDSTVIDQTFNDAELAGRPVTLGFNVSSTSGGFIFATTTNNYSPYLAVGDDAYDSTHDQILPGTSFQEVQTAFPLASSVLTGVFLNVVQSGPQGPSQTFSRTLVDRIGYAARQGLAPTSVSIPAGDAPALSNLDVYTLNVSAAADDPHPTAELDSELQTDAAQVAAVQDTTADAQVAETYATDYGVDLTRVLGNDFLTLSQLQTHTLATTSAVAAYFDSPRVVLISQQLDTGSSATPAGLMTAVDLLSDTPRVVPAPGQTLGAPFLFNLTRGMFENLIERNTVAALLPSGQTLAADNTYDVFNAATSQGIGFTDITGSNLGALDELSIPEDAKARITTDAQNGFVVIVPDQSVMLNGVPTIAWGEVDAATGEYIGVDANGGHEGALEFLALVGENLKLQVDVIKFFSPVAAFDSGAVLSVAYELNTAVGNQKAAAAQLKAQKQQVVDLYSSLVENAEFVSSFLKLANPSAITNAQGIDDLVAAIVGGVREAFSEAIPQIKSVFEQVLTATVLDLTGQDPGVIPILSNPVPVTALPSSRASGSVTASGPLAAGPVGGGAKAINVSVSGQNAASWSSAPASDFQASALNASNATVVDSGGKTIGAGPVAMATLSPVSAVLSGKDQYSVNGTGSLSFYGTAERSLGVSGDWQNYTATVTGNVSITLTVPSGALTLNGQALPAGPYTITTNSATLSGSGTMSSPNFAGSASITATSGTINLGPGSGTLSVGGKPLDPENETTLDGYTGTISVSADGDGTDSVSLNGNAGNVLQVTTTPATLTTDQNTPITFVANVQTSLADTYTLTANAPSGWTVSIDGSGNVTVTPAPGLQSGTYPIQIIAASQTDSNLIAQTTVEVTIKPTQPGINFTVASDPQFTVPFNGAQLPTAFRATIQNLGPAADTYNLTFSNVPTGFTILNSGTSVTVPAGETGILGIYLAPNTGQPIPPPGTQLSFTVTATSTTVSSITQTQTETFTVPDIDAVTLTSTPTSLSSSPGVAATATLTLQNVGNVPETVTLTATTPSGLTASSLSTITLAVGATQTETLTLTPDASTALNQTLATTITASFGPSSSLVTTTDEIDLLVQSAQAAAVSQASIAAGAANNSQLASVLTDLGNTLASLQSATSGALFAEAQNDLGNLNTLLNADPALTSFATQLQPVITAANADNLSGMLSGTTSLFNSITGVLNQEAAEQFTASVSPNEVDLQPGQGQTLTLTLTNTASDSENLNLSVGTLPSGVSVTLGESQVSMSPGATTTVSVTLSQTIQSTSIFTLDVTANAGVVQQAASAVVAIRPAAADVLSVTATPQAVNAGDAVTVSAQVFNTANATRSLLAQLQLLDQSNNVVATEPNVAVQLNPGDQAITVALGQISTTGLADGLYNLQVSLLASDGSPLPGKSAETPLLVGVPITASATASSSLLAPGTSTVTTTIQAQNATNVSNVVYNNATDFSITGNPNGAWSYGYLSPGASPDSSTFTPYANSGDNGGIKEWWAPFTLNTPSVFDNPTNGVLDYGTGVLQPGQAGFHPGPNGQYSVYRFTAPSTGSYSLSAVFTGIDHAGGTTTDVHVLDDGNSLFQGNINGYLNTSNYAATLNLNAGDTIDFVVGYGSDKSYLFDSTGLDATLAFNGAGSSGEDFVLYYTQYSGSQNVRQAVVNYNGSSFSIVSQKTVASGFAADGLVFAPDGSLIIGGIGAVVDKVNPITGAVSSVSTGGPGAFHLALDPSGKYVYTAAQPGEISVIPLDPFSNGTPHAVKGDDTGVAALAFDSAGVAYYTTGNGGNDPNANFGLIDLSTFTTRRIFSGLVAAHGMTFDPFTGDMILVGDNHVAQIDLKTMTIVSSLDLSSRGSFQLDQGTADGHGHLFVCDNFGHLLFIDYSKTGLIGDPSDFVATPSFDSFPDDVAPLSSLGAISALLEVQHLLPASGYNVDPTSITPTPGTSTSTEIDWLGGLLSGSSSTQQFQLTGQVTNMSPGETRQVSAGTKLTVQFTSGSGQQLQTTLSLPPVTVAAEHIISLTPPNQSVDRGADASYTVTLTNPSATDVTYNLTTEGLDGFTVGLVSSITVPAGQTVTTPLDLTVPLSAAADTTGFQVLASTTSGLSDSVEGELTVLSDVALQPRAVAMSISPTQATAGQGTSAQYVLTVNNVGSVEDTYALTVSGLPTGVTATLGQTTIDVPPGVSNFRDIPLTLSVKQGTTPGSYPFIVTATSTSDPTVTSTTSGTVTVVQNGVQVMLSPPTGSPGDTFTMTVTNTGSVTDTYDLAPAGPVGLVATLSQNKVTLAAGASQNITVTTSAINFAVPGPFDLTAIAKSEGNPSIVGAASSLLTIGNTQGLTGSLSPTVQILPIPGTTSFLLLVNNTGNTEDSYTASITGSSGPVAANLMGLDGNPTQSIPLFRLPGLSTGAILIQANLSAFGTGTVSVRVMSLSNNALTASETVTVSAALVAAKTQLVVTPNPATVGQAVTFTAIVTPASGSGAPIGTVTFIIDGKPQSPVDLAVVNGKAQATLFTSTLTQGQHTITASYSGNAPFASSLSNVVEEVVAPALVDGPQVTEFLRDGYHMMPTTLVLTFDQALDPTTAQDAKDYRIIGPKGRVIRIKSAVYDPATLSVTLDPKQRLNIHYQYKLIVDGSASGGVTNTEGQLLDGENDGKPGSDYRASITWRNLVLDPPLSSKNSRQSKTTTTKEHRPNSHSAHAVSHKAGLFTRSLPFRR